jgi:hypothetical protein
MYHPDGGTVVYGGGIICVNTRIRHTVQHDGWLYGFLYYNGTGGVNADTETVGEIPTGNPIAVRSALEVDGVIYPLFRNGVREPTLASGEIGEFRMLNGGAVYVQKGQVVFSRTKVLLSSASHAVPRYTRFAYWEGQATVGDYLMLNTSDQNWVDQPTSAWPAAADDPPADGSIGGSMPGPASALMILGGSKIQPVVEVWGTSRQEDWPISRGTALVDASGVYGRALTALGLPYVSCHRGSSRGWWEIKAANSAFRNALTAGCSIAIWAHGINDSNTGRTLAQMQADIREFCRRKRAEGKIVIAATEYPRTTSTDAWSSVAGQSIPNAANEQVRVNWNNWIRGLLTDAQIASAGGDPTIRRDQCFDDYIEIADAVESARDSGRFKAGNTVHESQATSGSSTTLVEAGAGWGHGQYHDQLVWITSGTGAGQVRRIVQNTSETLYITGTFSPAPNNTSGYRIVDAMVGDDATGLHASQSARALMAAAAQQTLAKYVK